MKAYCFDTSGISNPLEVMPADIHESMWGKITDIIRDGIIGVTTEIYGEMVHIPGVVGECIKEHKAQLVLEVSQGDWDWASYVKFCTEMNVAHHAFISEYSGGSPRTIGLVDMSIIALAKALHVPVVSMEVSAKPSLDKRRIPDVCLLEGVQHLTFSEFLRQMQIRL